MKTIHDFVQGVDIKAPLTEDTTLVKLRASMDSKLDEAIKGWKHAASDIAKARRDASDSAKTVHLHRLKADGAESGMHDARKPFNSVEDAIAHHENLLKLNPGKKIKHNLYIDGKMDRVLKEEVIVTEANDDLQSQIEKHLEPHIKSFNDGQMDPDTLGQHCIDTAEKVSKESGHPIKKVQDAVCNHIDKQLGEEVIPLQELGRHDEFEWVKGIKADQEEAERKKEPPKPISATIPPVKTSSFAVMHHDGQGWKVTKHDSIEGAAKEFARHSKDPNKRVKIVNHLGKVIHANHEAVDLTDDEVNMVNEDIEFHQDVISHLMSMAKAIHTDK